MLAKQVFPGTTSFPPPTNFLTDAIRAVAAAPQTPQFGGATLPKGAPNCLKEPKVASIQKQNFALRILRSDSIFQF